MQLTLCRYATTDTMTAGRILDGKGLSGIDLSDLSSGDIAVPLPQLFDVTP